MTDPEPSELRKQLVEQVDIILRHLVLPELGPDLRAILIVVPKIPKESENDCIISSSISPKALAIYLEATLREINK